MGKTSLDLSIASPEMLRLLQLDAIVTDLILMLVSYLLDLLFTGEAVIANSGQLTAMNRQEEQGPC